MAQCIDTSEIQDGDWIAYLHGEASAKVVEHIARCGFCARQIEEMRMVDAQLLAAFYRDNCPTPELLASLAFDDLPAAEKLRVAAHVRGCTACGAEIDSLRTLADQPPSLLARLRESLALALVARPVAPAAVPVRGAGWQGRYEADDLVITLSSKGGELIGRVRKRQTVADADHSGQAWLLPEENGKEDQPPSSEIDGRGRFHFTSVIAGSYALLLQIGEQDVALEAIRVA